MAEVDTGSDRWGKGGDEVPEAGLHTRWRIRNWYWSFDQLCFFSFVNHRPGRIADHVGRMIGECSFEPIHIRMVDPPFKFIHWLRPNRTVNRLSICYRFVIFTVNQCMIAHLPSVSRRKRDRKLRAKSTETQGHLPPTFSLMTNPQLVIYFAGQILHHNSHLDP